MKFKFIVFATAIVCVLTAKSALAQDHPDQATLRGFLVDAHYISDLLSYESLTQKAKTYTKEIGLSSEARKSGYGIVVGQKFYAFDAKGNELATELLRKTEKVSAISVEVVGTLPRGSVNNDASPTKKAELGRDKLGRPTYDQIPGQSANQTYGRSVTFGGHQAGGEKIAVESIGEVSPGGAARP